MEYVTNCPNCAAPLTKDGRCEYCGTVVERNNDNIVYHKVVTTNRPIQKIACMTMVTDEAKRCMPPEYLEEYTKEQMIKSIAHHIADFVVFQSEYDPIRMTEIVRATIGVADMRGE